MTPMRTVAVEKHRPALVFQQATEKVIYPDSDGAPMGETEIHVLATFDLFSALRLLLRDVPNTYVAADMFLYYKKGDPSACTAPDVMVAKGVVKRQRRSFKVWQEGGAIPCVVFEVTSKTTVIEDTVTKSHLYASLGVREYYLFDPLREYLKTGLTGFVLDHDEYVEMKPEGTGVFFSEELGVFLTARDLRVRIIDPKTHQPVPDLDEALEKAAQEAERAKQEMQRADQEAQRADQERCRAEQAEAELARLQELLKQQQ